MRTSLRPPQRSSPLKFDLNKTTSKPTKEEKNVVEAEVEGIRTEAEEIETRVDFQISHFEVMRTFFASF